MPVDRRERANDPIPDPSSESVNRLNEQFNSFRVRIPLTSNSRNRRILFSSGGGGAMSPDRPDPDAGVSSLPSSMADYTRNPDRHLGQTPHDHIRWSNDDNLNIIPRVLSNDPVNSTVASTSFFRSHPEHSVTDDLSSLIQEFGLMGFMNKNLMERKTGRHICAKTRNTGIGEKRKYAQIDSPTEPQHSEQEPSISPQSRRSSFLQPGMAYAINNADGILTQLKFTELFEDDNKVKGIIESGQVGLEFVGEIVDFVDNDLRSSSGNKNGIEASVFSNLLRNGLCFDKDLRKFIGRHKRTSRHDPNWKPFYLDKFGYLKSNGSRSAPLQKAKETKFPNSSVFHKVSSMCGNKGSTYKCLARWFELPPFNEFVNTPYPPTPPGAKRKTTNNPENLVVCQKCQDLIMENFILMKLKIDLEDLLKDSKNMSADLKIKNDMRYKRRRRLKPLTSYDTRNNSLVGSPLDNSNATPILSSVTGGSSPPVGSNRPQYYNHERTRGFIFGAGHHHFIENFRQQDEERPRRIRLLDYLVSRQQWRYDPDLPQQLQSRQQSNNGDISTDSDFSDDELRRNFLMDDTDNNHDDNDDGDDTRDDDDDDDDENDEDPNVDELYDVELSSGRSRRIENLLFERNLNREQQHHRRGTVLARKLYKNNSSTKLSLQIYVSINRLTGELYLIPGNLDKNNWSSEENDGELFEDYQTFLKLYRIFNSAAPSNNPIVEEELGTSHYRELKEYLDSNKKSEKERIQKLLLLNLISNPTLYLFRSDSKPPPFDVSSPSPTLLSPGNLPCMGPAFGKRKNRKHQEDEVEVKDALKTYFNETVNFNFDTKKILKLNPNYAKANGNLNLFGSFYSFSYS